MTKMTVVEERSEKQISFFVELGSHIWSFKDECTSI